MSKTASVHHCRQADVNYSTPCWWEQPSPSLAPCYGVSRHIPSGRTHVIVVYLDRPERFLALLDVWNRMLPDDWIYRTATEKEEGEERARPPLTFEEMMAKMKL